MTNPYQRPPLTQRMPWPDGFRAAVAFAIERMVGDGEFSVPDVEAFMGNHGFKLPKEPRMRISMVVKSLRDEGLLERTHEGSGSEPNRYKKVKK